MPDPALLRDLQRAHERYLAGDLAQAESICQQILTRDPNCSNALHGLGLIACQRKEYEAAAKFLEQAVALSPGDAIAHCNLGTVYQSLNRPDHAIASFRQSLRLKDDALTHYNLGTVLQEQGWLN